MKRHLTIAIDANRVTCDPCKWFLPWPSDWTKATCRLFKEDLQAEGETIDGLNNYARCAPCLAAEREAGE
jgi:hypothetical protein